MLDHFPGDKDTDGWTCWLRAQLDKHLRRTCADPGWSVLLDMFQDSSMVVLRWRRGGRKYQVHIVHPVLSTAARVAYNSFLNIEDFLDPPAEIP